LLAQSTTNGMRVDCLCPCAVSVILENAQKVLSPPFSLPSAFFSCYLSICPCATFSAIQFLLIRCLLACNEDTVPCVQTLDADYSKNPDAVLGILCQMLSGKSFELIHSAAAVTGKLPVFAAEFIKSVRYYHHLS